MMRCIECGTDRPKLNRNLCWGCYNRMRRAAIKAGTWKLRPTPPSVLTDTQQQVMIGGLLGDSHLRQRKKNWNPELRIQRAKKDEAYLTYQYELFEDFCSKGIKHMKRKDKRTGSVNESVCFYTQHTPAFIPFRQQWYPRGKKIVPKELKLTPLICAIWFCDDGSVCKQGKYQNRLRFTLYTNGFTKKDNEFLAQLLRETIGGKFNVSRIWQDGKKYYCIIFSEIQTTLNFIKYIEPCMPESMKRKSDIWKGFTGQNMRSGERISTAKLNLTKVAEIIQLHKDGVSADELSKRYGVGKTTIYSIINGTSWQLNY